MAENTPPAPPIPPVPLIPPVRPAPPVPPMPPGQPSLPDQPYESIDSLMSALNSWGKNHGLGFIKTGGSNKVNGQLTYVTVACDRGGQKKASRATIRRTSTSKTKCCHIAYMPLLPAGN